MTGDITVEVAYVGAEAEFLQALKVPAQTTVEQAIIDSGVLEKFSDIDLQKNKVGIFAVIVELSQVLNDGDRVEIYRPLQIDPKQKRKQRHQRHCEER